MEIIFDLTLHPKPQTLNPKVAHCSLDVLVWSKI